MTTISRERVAKIENRISIRKAAAMGNYRFEEADLWRDLLAILRWYQERHDEAGEGRSSAELADGAMRRNGEAGTPDAPSPGLSIDSEADESVLASIIIRDKHDLPDWHLTFATRDYLRSRLAPRRVTREWLEYWVSELAENPSTQQRIAIPMMLRSIGVEVSE